MKSFNMTAALSLSVILASPACTDEFGSIGDNGGAANPDSVGGSTGVLGLGGSPLDTLGTLAFGGSVSTTGEPTLAFGGSVSTTGEPSIGNGGSVSTTMGCECPQLVSADLFVGCADGTVMAPYCATDEGGGCQWIPRPCPGVVAGSGGTSGTSSTGPYPAVGGALTTGSGGTSSIATGTPTFGGSTSTLQCPAVTLDIPTCGAGSVTILYDAGGCIIGFVCTLR
jgi:hypothetical protein